MKVVVVYGSPCSGKTTYLKEHIGKNDVVYDYSRILAALTYGEEHSETNQEKPISHNVVIKIRQAFINSLKELSEINVAYILTGWLTDSLRQDLSGLEVEYKYINTPQNECLRRMENDNSRKDKKAWKKIIDDWFKNHTNPIIL